MRGALLHDAGSLQLRTAASVLRQGPAGCRREGAALGVPHCAGAAGTGGPTQPDPLEGWALWSIDLGDGGRAALEHCRGRGPRKGQRKKGRCWLALRPRCCCWPLAAGGWLLELMQGGPGAVGWQGPAALGVVVGDGAHWWCQAHTCGVRLVVVVSLPPSLPCSLHPAAPHSPPPLEFLASTLHTQ